MVEKFKQLLETIVRERGPVALFAILKMDEYTDKWTILLSANWTNDTSFTYLRDLLIGKFSAEEMATIARLGIFAKTEHIIQELLKYKEGATIAGEKINGNFIHEGHLLASNSSV